MTLRLPSIFSRWATRYGALSRRERMMVAAALVICPALIVNALWLDPLRLRASAVRAHIDATRTQLANESSLLAALNAQAQADPDAAARAALSALQAERQRLDGQLEEIDRSLITPREMNGLLRQVLARQPGLRLMSLQTLPPQRVLPADPGHAASSPIRAASEHAVGLYRHGVEIRLQGSYDELGAYLRQLELLGPRLGWGDLEYQVLEFPRAEMKLRAYTLSRDQAWLSL
ncbi:MAG: hypothetical protein JO006_03650 [Paucibacter sp.]|nr:hypothetical protein [Roseateles sp.]